MTTLVAALGPAFAIVIVYVIVPPGAADVAGVVFVIERSAETTCVVAVTALLPVLLSKLSLDAVTVSLIVPDVATTFTSSTKKPLPAAGKEAIEQVIVPVPPTAGVVHDQNNGGFIATNVVPAGTVCVIFTLVAVSGPLFVIDCVYVSVPPVATGSGESTFVAERSAV